MNGIVYGAIGAALAMILSCIGSCIAVGRAGMLSAGLMAKGQGKFGNMLILQLLPATQGLYGFIVAFLAMNGMGFIGGQVVTMSAEIGWSMFFACLPVGIVGLISAIYQGKVAMGGIELCAKQDKQMGRAMTMAALVEIFAIFSLVISLLAVLGLTSGLAV